jgi:hypothetical protein
MASHFNQCFERLVKPLRDYDYDGIGDLGAANILNLGSWFKSVEMLIFAEKR